MAESSDELRRSLASCCARVLNTSEDSPDENIEIAIFCFTSHAQLWGKRLRAFPIFTDDKDGQKILALARQLPTMAEPTTLQQVLAEKKKHPQRELARKPPARRLA
jgi:hypothetical protein